MEMGIKITKKSKLDVKVMQNDSSTCELTFDMKVTLEVTHQLLSPTMLVQKGWIVMTV